MTGVFAGNYNQFVQWCLDAYRAPADYKEVFYVYDADSIRGKHDVNVIRYGTFYERPDYDEIEQEIKTMEAQRELHQAYCG